MYLRDITIHAHEDIVDEFKGGFVARFHRETGCVVDHFLTLISGKIKDARHNEGCVHLCTNR